MVPLTSHRIGGNNGGNKGVLTITKKLTARTVENLGPGRHSDGTGTGLMLWVSKTGARTWVQRIRYDGKRHDVGLGGFPVISLAEAREIALENKRAVARGENPIHEKRKAKEAARKRITFAEATRRAHVELSPTWKNPKDRAAFLSTLESYAWPYFGETFMSEVKSAQIRKVILACREDRPGVAKKLTYRINSVFRWAIAENHCQTNPASSDLLALPRMDHKPTNRQALHYSEVSNAIESVKASNAWPATKLAIEFCILTAARSGEVRGAQWDEIDIENATWTVPGDRMKMGLEHRVPLTSRALEILHESKAIRDISGLVFPSKRGRMLSDMTLSKLVRELGIPSTVHGFRTSFRTWTQERTNSSSEVAEAALAHVISNKAAAAYARSDLLEKRRNLMENWTLYLNAESSTVSRIA